MAEGCSKRMAEEVRTASPNKSLADNSQGLAKHMSTAPVAKDIIEIFERHGEWREQEAERLLSVPGAASLSEAERDDVVARTSYKPGREMVQYWGFVGFFEVVARLCLLISGQSYGTILGAHLPAMYPERIQRAVLDGVSDAHDYMAAGWSTNLRDTDLLIPRLAEYCYAGGPDNCALFDKDGPTVIAAKVQKAFTILQHDPIAIQGNNTAGPSIVTYDDLKSLIQDIVYNPLLKLPLTAQILQELLEGGGTTLATWKAEQRPALGEPLSKKCLDDGPYSASCFPSHPNWESALGIECTDGLSRLDETKEEFRQYTDILMAQSSLLGARWASIMLPCTAWHVRPHWRYEGNFRNKTAYPILFAGNTLDPVTPLHNAFTMAEGFEGAGILHQDSEGHCTYGSPSMCTGKAVREYFQTGSIPGKEGRLEGWSGHGALCKPDRVPFDGYKTGSMPEMPKGETDREMWDALVGLNQAWP